MNFLDIEVRIENGGAAWIAYDGRRLADLPCTINPVRRPALRETLQAGIRPNRIEFSETRMRDSDLAAEVGTYESIGERGILTVRLKSQDLTILTPPDQTYRKARQLWVHCALKDMYFFTTVPTLVE